MRLFVCFLLVVATVFSAPLEDKVNGLKADSREVQAFGQSLKDNKEKEEFKKFVDFIKRYDRRYINVNELKKRFKAFQASLVEVEKFQKLDKGATYGVTKFSDFEVSELGEIRGFRTSTRYAGPPTTQSIHINGTTVISTTTATTTTIKGNNKTMTATTKSGNLGGSTIRIIYP